MKNTVIAISVGAALLIAVVAFAQGGMGWGGHMRGGPGYHMYGEDGQDNGRNSGYGPGPRYNQERPGYGRYPGYCWAPNADRAPYPNTAPPSPENETDPGR